MFHRYLNLINYYYPRIVILPVEKWIIHFYHIHISFQQWESRRDGAAVGGNWTKNAGVAALGILSGGKYSLAVVDDGGGVLLAQRKLASACGGAVVPDFSQLCHYTRRVHGCFAKKERERAR